MPPSIQWYPKLIDARLSETEMTAWEQMVAEGIQPSEATNKIVARRLRGAPADRGRAGTP